MKYRLKERVSRTGQSEGHILLRYGELFHHNQGQPNNAELQFWLQYEECIELLKDIQKEHQRGDRALSGPWLPVELCVRGDNIIKEYEGES